MKQRTGYETVCLISGLRVCHLISGDGVWPMFGPPRPRSNLCEPPRFGRQGAMGQGPPCALIKLSNPTSCRNRGRSGVWRRRGSGSTVYPDRVHRSGDAEMAATSTLVAAAAIITLVALTTRAEAQSLSPYYGPDGRVYYRRADPAIPQQPYAAPQTVPAPTTTAPAPRAQKVKVKPKPKPKPDTPGRSSARADRGRACDQGRSACAIARRTERGQATPACRMVRARRQCESATVSQSRIIEGAAMTRLDHAQPMPKTTPVGPWSRA